MKTLLRIKSNIKPNAIESLGNGHWYYNYDIQEEQRTATIDGQEITETLYSYVQIRMFGKPTYKKCTELIIREYLTQSLEFDLINSYNRAAFNLLSDEEDGEKYVNDYVDYLNTIKLIKDNIKKDF